MKLHNLKNTGVPNYFWLLGDKPLPRKGRGWSEEAGDETVCVLSAEGLVFYFLFISHLMLIDYYISSLLVWDACFDYLWMHIIV